MAMTRNYLIFQIDDDECGAVNDVFQLTESDLDISDAS